MKVTERLRKYHKEMKVGAKDTQLEDTKHFDWIPNRNVRHL